MAADALSPQDALKHMKVTDGFSVKLVASEPEIRQPLSVSFDARGRMWVIQYLQYPTPAGLNPVSVDQYLRTQYDRVPEPPPRGPKGTDRITICEDTNGDGRFDKFKDFVSGLNLASGLALGYEGVFIVQPPYLLFYPDRNHDDVPDGDPEVLLSGFGLEDSHALANSLTWGPDGWLYGAQGSTVTAHIRGLEFQQGIWRYHPVSHEFEVFAEGGGNTWGVDFDEHGNLIAGTNFGEQIGLHQVQGGYYIKGFSKHGPLHNPYTFGYFDHIPYTGFKGGHVTSGGIIYHGGAFPGRFNGTYIAGNLLANAVYWHVLDRDGSSFKGHFGGELLSSDDVWFRPVDLTIGPDGAVYVADWYDKRATHVDPLDTWDRSNGRIYKIESTRTTRASHGSTGGSPSAPSDISKLSSGALVKLLSAPNDWFRREARQLLAERRDPKIIPKLRKNVFDARDDHLALESLWALYVSGGFNDELAARLLAHANADVRVWTIRFLGDAREVTGPIEKQLVTVARTEPNPAVRSQLACSARRLPGKDALPIISELLQRDADAGDPQIPLLLWWAVESKAISDAQRVVDLFSAASIWRHDLVRNHIVERVARRYAAEGTPEGFAACARLLSLAPGNANAELVLQGMELALTGKRLDRIPAPLETWFTKAWQRQDPGPGLIRLGLRLANPSALELALKTVSDERASESERAALAEILGQIREQASIPALLKIFEKSNSPALRNAALSALRHFPDRRVADAVVEMYSGLDSKLRQRAQNALCTRPTWAASLLDAVDAGKIARAELSFDQLRQLAALKDPTLDARLEKGWGRIQPASDEEKQNTVNRLRLVLNPSGAAGRTGKGDAAAGKLVFQQNCAVCHRLFGEGNTIGPDLTGADRKNTEGMLFNIVNPSAYIRPEYVGYDATTKDDESLAGLMVESSPAAVTILDRSNQRHVLARDQIKELNPSKVSLMPEGLLEALTPGQVMDLFAYLQGDGQVAATTTGKQIRP
jgi:putative membrane-bound dehydrogenase-like protein